MSKKVLVIAPHPDDETLGCGGTILRHINQNDDVSWLICTSMRDSSRYTDNEKDIRDELINKVSLCYQFSRTDILDFRSGELEAYKFSQIVEKVKYVVSHIRPSIIYLPYYSDAHSDHRLIYEAVMACTKIFRAPYLHEMYCYEVLSETNFNPYSNYCSFSPNCYVDISDFIQKKLEIVDLYHNEMQPFPFPRNSRLVKAQSDIRGSESMSLAAEAFVTIKRILK